MVPPYCCSETMSLSLEWFGSLWFCTSVGTWVSHGSSLALKHRSLVRSCLLTIVSKMDC